MNNEKIFNMLFAKVYLCLVNKAVKKKKTIEEVNQIITWLTSYSFEEIVKLSKSNITYQEFFEKAPLMNEHRFLIKGKICNVDIEKISSPLMKDMRILDKMIDDLAKGKPLNKILPKI